MSVSDEVKRLETAKSNLRTAINNKGVAISAGATLEDYPSYVNLITTANDVDLSGYAQKAVQNVFTASQEISHSSNPYLQLTFGDTIFYMQGYTDATYGKMLGFGPSWVNALKVAPNGTVVSPGQIIAKNQILTSFKSAVATGSYESKATTVTALVEEVRYSSGCMGSVCLASAYNSIPAGWYNFIYAPHRSGGTNGAANNDNCAWGTLLLMGMTVQGHFWRIRISQSSIGETARVIDTSYTGTLANSISGNAATATKLATARTITLSGAATATATSFNGTSNISIPVTAIKEAYLEWGGKSWAGEVGPIGSALSSEHSANRIAYLNPAAIQVEYSTDGGTTYSDYGLTDEGKIGLVTRSADVKLGKSGTATTSMRARVTLTGCNGTTTYCYTRPRKLLINFNINGHNISVTVEAKKGSSDATWVNLGTYPVSGWSGWNDIPLSHGTFGGGASQTSNYWYFRLTFAITSVSSTYASSLPQLISLRMFGDTCWTRTSNLGETGHLYSYDNYQNATFPANIKATTFNSYTVSDAANKKTLVTRDGNGYSFFSYINSNTSNNENPTISQIIVTNGSDNYFRKASLAHLKSSLGSMPASDVYAWAKASTKPSYSWSEISGRPSQFESVKGLYTGNGGAQKPSYIGSNTTRFNMMNSFVNSSGAAIVSFSSYADVMLMNNYSWSDVPYATALAIQKTNGIPRAWIAAGPQAGWAGATELVTMNNLGNQVANSAPTLSWGSTSTIGTIGGKALTVTLPANPDTNTSHGHLGGPGLEASGASGGNAFGICQYTLKLYTPSPTASSTIGTTSKVYALGVDSNDQLCVSVPWTDTGATSITTSGSGNAVTSASYNASTRQITLSKGATFVTTNTEQTISAVKTFTAESKFTNSQYCPTFTDIASGIGKSSCFTRGAHMQVITGQILAPNAAASDTTRGYNTEVGKIKFQSMTAKDGQPVVTDMAVIDSTGIKEKGTYLANKYAAISHTHSDYISKNSSPTISGDLTVNWLKTNSITNLGSVADRICVLRADNWMYYRTAAELKSDMGIKTETWTFTLDDGTTVTKVVNVG